MVNHSINSNTKSSAAPDLLSFASWEYEANASCNASLITTSFSGEDFSLSGTGTTSAFNNNDISAERMLTLNVSGVVFHVEPKIFRHLERLPWKTTSTSPTSNTNSSLQARGASNDEHDLYLRTAPELFEIILSHVLYGSFPDVRTLRTADVEELEPLVMLLELTSLQRYLEQNDHWVGTHRTTQHGHSSSSSSRRKIVLSRVPSLTRRHRRAGSGSTGSNEMMNHHHQQQQQRETAMLEEQRDGPPPPPPSSRLNPAETPVVPSSSSMNAKSNSPTITSKKPMVKPQESGRMMRRLIKASLARAANSSISAKSMSSSQRRLTHAELCAKSDVVN